MQSGIVERRRRSTSQRLLYDAKAQRGTGSGARPADGNAARARVSGETIPKRLGPEPPGGRTSDTRAWGEGQEGTKGRRREEGCSRAAKRRPRPKRSKPNPRAIPRRGPAAAAARPGAEAAAPVPSTREGAAGADPEFGYTSTMHSRAREDRLNMGVGTRSRTQAARRAMNELGQSPGKPAMRRAKGHLELQAARRRGHRLQVTARRADVRVLRPADQRGGAAHRDFAGCRALVHGRGNYSRLTEQIGSRSTRQGRQDPRHGRDDRHVGEATKRRELLR